MKKVLQMNKKGVALITVLGLLSMLLLMGLVFADLSRSERMASSVAQDNFAMNEHLRSALHLSMLDISSRLRNNLPGDLPGSAAQHDYDLVYNGIKPANTYLPLGRVLHSKGSGTAQGLFNSQVLEQYVPDALIPPQRQTPTLDAAVDPATLLENAINYHTILTDFEDRAGWKSFGDDNDLVYAYVACGLNGLVDANSVLTRENITYLKPNFINYHHDRGYHPAEFGFDGLDDFRPSVPGSLGRVTDFADLRNNFQGALFTVNEIGNLLSEVGGGDVSSLVPYSWSYENGAWDWWAIPALNLGNWHLPIDDYWPVITHTNGLRETKDQFVNLLMETYVDIDGNQPSIPMTEEAAGEIHDALIDYIDNGNVPENPDTICMEAVPMFNEVLGEISYDENNKELTLNLYIETWYPFVSHHNNPGRPIGGRMPNVREFFIAATDVDIDVEPIGGDAVSEELASEMERNNNYTVSLKGALSDPTNDNDPNPIESRRNGGNGANSIITAPGTFPHVPGTYAIENDPGQFYITKIEIKARNASSVSPSTVNLSEIRINNIRLRDSDGNEIDKLTISDDLWNNASSIGGTTNYFGAQVLDPRLNHIATFNRIEKGNFTVNNQANWYQNNPKLITAADQHSLGYMNVYDGNVDHQLSQGSMYEREGHLYVANGGILETIGDIGYIPTGLQPWKTFDFFTFHGRNVANMLSMVAQPERDRQINRQEPVFRHGKIHPAVVSYDVFESFILGSEVLSTDRSYETTLRFREAPMIDYASYPEVIPPNVPGFPAGSTILDAIKPVSFVYRSPPFGGYALETMYFADMPFVADYSLYFSIADMAQAYQIEPSANWDPFHGIEAYGRFAWANGFIFNDIDQPLSEKPYRNGGQPAGTSTFDERFNNNFRECFIRDNVNLLSANQDLMMLFFTVAKLNDQGNPEYRRSAAALVWRNPLPIVTSLNRGYYEPDFSVRFMEEY